MRNFIFIFILMVVSIAGRSIYAKPGDVARKSGSWEDLQEEARSKIYGSEREKKFPVYNPLLQLESWEDHFSLDILFLYRYTNYPKFTSHRFLFSFAPLIYSLNSKFDGREQSWFFPFYYKKNDEIFQDGKVQGTTSTLLTPLFSKKSKVYGNESSRAEIDSLFSLLYSRETQHDCYKDCELTKSTTRFPAIPFIYYQDYNKYDNTSVYNFLTLFHLRSENDSVKQSWFIPLFYKKNGEILRNGEVHGKTSTLLTPLFYNYSGVYGSGENLTKSNFLISPIYIRKSQHDCSGDCEVTKSETLFPALPVIYYHDYDKQDNTSVYNILTLFHIKYENDSLKQSWLMPFYHLQNDEIIKNGKVQGTTATLLTPLFYNYSRVYGSGENRAESNFLISPIYIRKSQHDCSGDCEVTKSETLFPALPVIYYHDYDKQDNTSVYNILTLFHIESENDLVKRSWFMPFYFWGKSGKNWSDYGYFHILPPVVMNFSDRSTFVSFFFPLYLYWTEATNFTGIYTIPFQYHREGTKKIVNFLYPLVHYKSNGGEVQKLWTPLLYYYKRDSYLHIPVVLFFSWKNEREKTIIAPFYYSYESSDVTKKLVGPAWKYSSKEGLDSSFHFIPFYFSWDKEYQSDTEPLLTTREKVRFTPLYFYYNEKHRVTDTAQDNDNGEKMAASGNKSDQSKPLEYERSILTVPALPLYTAEKDTRFGNRYRFLYAFQWDSNADGQVEKTWIPPIFLYRSESYFHIPVALFFSWRNEFEKTVVSPLTLYFSYENSEISRSLIGPVWSSHRKDDVDSSFHIIPFYFSWNEEYVDSSRIPLKVAEQSTFTPFYYYKKESHIVTASAQSDNDSKDIKVEKSSLSDSGISDNLEYNRSFLAIPGLPLFTAEKDTRTGNKYSFLYAFQWKSDTEGSLESSMAFPLLFYEKNDYFTFFPLFYRSVDLENRSGFSVSPLFYYNRWNEESESFYLGLYYSNESKTSDEHLILSPLYYSWKTSESKGRIILPFSFEYEDNTKYMSLYLGWYSSKNAGYLSGTASLSTDKGLWFLDTDLSFMYDLFSIQTRTSFGTPEDYEDPENVSIVELEKLKERGTIQPVSASQTVMQSETETASPEASLESEVAQPQINKKKGLERDQSKTYRGWSALFGVISYAQADGTRKHIHALPLGWFTWDDTQQESLSTFIPLYFHYDTPDLEYQVILPPIYGKQRKGNSFIEAYMLIGFINEYDAERDQREFSALWPIFNYYTRPDNMGWRVFPVLFYKKATTETEKSERFISPLYYSHDREIFAANESTEELQQLNEVDNFSISPFHIKSYTASNDVERSTFTFPVVPVVYSSTKKEYLNRSNDQTPHTIYNTDWILPFYYYNDTEISNEEGFETITSTFFAPIIPLYIDLYRSGYRYIIAPGYYYENEGDSSYHNFLFLAEYSSEAESSKTNFLFRTYDYRQNPEESSLSLLYGLLYDHKFSRKNDDYRVNTMLYLYGQENAGERFYSYLFPLFYYSKTEDESDLFIAGFYLHRSPHEDRENLLYVIDHTEDKEKAQDRYDYLFSAITYTSDEKENKFDILYNTLYNYTGSKDSKDYEWNALLYLAGMGREGEDFHLRFAPLFFYQSGSDFYKWFLFPGLYVRNDENSARQNFLYVIDHTEDKEKVQDRYDYLFSAITYTSDEKENKFDILYNTLYNYTGSKDSKDYEWNALLYLAGMRREGEKLHLRFAPLFFHWSDPKSYKGFYLGLYMRKDEDSSRQNFLYLYDHEYHKDDDENNYDLLFSSLSFSSNSDRSRSQFLFGPGYDYYNSKENDDYEFESLLYLIGVSQYGENFHWRFAPLFFHWEDEKSYEGFYLGLYMRKDEDSSRQNFLYLYDHKYHKEDEENEYDLLFSSLSFSSNSDSSRSQFLFGPGYDYYNSKENDDYRFESLLYLIEVSQYGENFHWRFAPLFFHWSDPKSYEGFYLGLYLRKDEDSSRQNFLYLFDHEYNKKDEGNRYGLLFSTISHSVSENSKGTDFLYGLGFDYYRSRKNDNYDLNILLGLANMNRYGDNFHLHFAPLFFHWSDPKSYEGFYAGLYMRKDDHSSRRNFLYLFDYERNDELDSRHFGLAFNTIDYRREGDLTSINLLYGLGADYESRRGSPDYDYNMLLYLYGQSREGDRFSSRFIPAWYYKRQPNNSLLLMPIIPVLHYYSTENNGILDKSTHLSLLGGLWYSKKERELNGSSIKTIRDNKLFLLGTYFNYNDYRKGESRDGILGGLIYWHSKKPLRGYESYGSLWGLLWNYERESETGYNKLSILKFLYSKTRTESGETYARILGVKVYSSKK